MRDYDSTWIPIAVILKKVLRTKLDVIEWTGVGDHERVHRQLSVSSDSKLLDEDIREEARVILRPRRPPRPKSEVFLGPDPPPRRTKRFSAFGVMLSSYLLCLFFNILVLNSICTYIHIYLYIYIYIYIFIGRFPFW